MNPLKELVKIIFYFLGKYQDVPDLPHCKQSSRIHSNVYPALAQRGHQTFKSTVRSYTAQDIDSIKGESDHEMCFQFL